MVRLLDIGDRICISKFYIVDKIFGLVWLSDNIKQC